MTFALLLTAAALLLVDPSSASWSGDVLCDPQFPGNNTNCTCAPGHDGCALPDCIDRCTCPGGNCVMDICLTNCVCPDGGCVMDECISECDNGGVGGATACDVGARCYEEGSTCTEGTETCCGETHPSLECTCGRNSETYYLEYQCMFTDACLNPACAEQEPEPEPDTPGISGPTGPAFVNPSTLSTETPPTVVTPAVCDVDAQCFEEGSSCTEGTETCCGETHDSLVCVCEKNPDTNSLAYLCYYTDACFAPACETEGDAKPGVVDGTTLPTEAPPGSPATSAEVVASFGIAKVTAASLATAYLSMALIA